MVTEKKIKIVVDNEKLRTTEKLRNILAAQKGDLEAGINILAKYAFYVNGSTSKPVPFEEAKEFLLDHTSADLEQMLSTFNQEVSEKLVSP